MLRIVTIDSHHPSSPRGVVPSTSLPAGLPHPFSAPTTTPAGSGAPFRRPQQPNTATTSLVPATRSRLDLEHDDECVSEPSPLSFLHPSARAHPPSPPHRELDPDVHRARKRPRVDSLSSVTSAERSLLPDDPFYPRSMRLTGTDADSMLSVSPDDTPEAGPSTPAPSNGHNGIVKGYGFSAPFANGNGKALLDGHRPEKQRMSVAKVSLPGTTLYDDSYVDREEFVRLVIQSLRDVGYM